MSPSLRASNEGLLRDRALREHRGLTGPSLPLLAGFFSILLPFHQLSVGIVRRGRLRPSPSCRKRNPSASV
jgi:hypothetical protein